MITPFDRRRVLLGLGQAATLGGLSAAMPGLARAAQAAAAQQQAAQKVCLTMLYPTGDGLTFDADGFRDRHLAILTNAYGNTVERIELRVTEKPPEPPPPAEGEEPLPAPPPPPVLAVVSMWLANISGFTQRVPTAAKAVNEDMAKITRSAPMVQFDVIEGQAGDPASSVLGGTTVLSSYFFAKEGGQWDGEYFGKTFVPKLMTAYPPGALARVEVSRGYVAQGGGAPLIAGAMHLYIKDAAAFDAAAGNEANMELGKEAAGYTTLNPVRLVMSVHATA